MIGSEAFIGQTSTGEKPPKPDLTTNDVIIPGYNQVDTPSEVVALDESGAVSPELLEDSYEEIEFRELAKMLPNLADEAIYASHIAEPEHRQKVAESYARAIEAQIAPFKNEDRASEIAQQAIKALRRRMTTSQVVQRLASDNRAAHQLAGQRSRELAAEREDSSAVDTKLRNRKKELLRQLAEAGPTGERSEQIIEELQFLKELIDRDKRQAVITGIEATVVPSTDELEDMLANVTPEHVSPARGVRLLVAGQALKMSDGLHHFADVVLPEAVPVE